MMKKPDAIKVPIEEFKAMRDIYINPHQVSEVEAHPKSADKTLVRMTNRNIYTVTMTLSAFIRLMTREV